MIRLRRDKTAYRANALLGPLLFTAAVGQQEDSANQQPEDYLDPVLKLDGIQERQSEEKHEDGKAGSWFDFFPHEVLLWHSESKTQKARRA